MNMQTLPCHLILINSSCTSSQDEGNLILKNKATNYKKSNLQKGIISCAEVSFLSNILLLEFSRFFEDLVYRFVTSFLLIVVVDICDFDICNKLT